MSPGELLDTSIAQLEMLRAFLRDQLWEMGGESDGPCTTAEVRACAEILLSLSTLIPNVQTVRNETPSGENGRRRKLGAGPEGLDSPP